MRLHKIYFLHRWSPQTLANLDISNNKYPTSNVSKISFPQISVYKLMAGLDEKGIQSHLQVPAQAIIVACIKNCMVSFPISQFIHSFSTLLITLLISAFIKCSCLLLPLLNALSTYIQIVFTFILQ